MLEFEKVDDHPDNDEVKKQRWKHEVTFRYFWVNRTKSGKTWETGVWNKQLEIIAAGKMKAAGNVDTIQRACYILNHRKKHSEFEVQDLTLSPNGKPSLEVAVRASRAVAVHQPSKVKGYYNFDAIIFRRDKTKSEKDSKDRS